jgi:hypothetical protein
MARIPNMTMTDQAMDIDIIAPSATPAEGPTFKNKTARSRYPPRASRNFFNLKPTRAAPHHHPGLPKIQKTSKIDLVKLRTYRQKLRRRVRAAIADGSFHVQQTDGGLPNHLDGDSSIEGMVPGHPGQVRRLDEGLVAAALYEPVPGMTFDPAAAPSDFFLNGQQASMADLVRALEAFQAHLAQKGHLVLSDGAGPGRLLRTLARDILGTVLHCPRASSSPNHSPAAVGFWDHVAEDYVAYKIYRSLAARAQDKFKQENGLCGIPYRKMVVETLGTLDKYPQAHEVCFFFFFFFFFCLAKKKIKAKKTKN